MLKTTLKIGLQSAILAVVMASLIAFRVSAASIWMSVTPGNQTVNPGYAAS